MTPRTLVLIWLPLAAACWLVGGLFVLAVHFLLTHDALPLALLCVLAVPTASKAIGAYFNETRKERK